MAGLAALMTRKKRDRRRELELKQQMQEGPEVTSKEAAALATKKAANEALKKLILGQEIQKQQRLQKQQQSQSQDAVSNISYAENEEEGPFGSSGNAYTAIYIGLVLICIGIVITFVGLGDKGFKTLELKMIGPVLCLIGLTCITIKIIHCSFPTLFKSTKCMKKAKLRDSDRSNLMEKGLQNGHFGKKAASPRELSPRVHLQSSKKAARPTSTIPNYIGHEESSDDDDFDPGRSRPHSNRFNIAYEQSPIKSPPLKSTRAVVNTAAEPTTPVAVFNPSPQNPQVLQASSTRTPPQTNEILLSPHGLIL